MTLTVTDYSKHDEQIWHEELADFVPQRVFDAHIHLLNTAHIDTAVSGAFAGWNDAAMADIKGWAQRLYPERETHFLVLGTPSPGIDVEAHNRWVLGEVETDPQSRLNRLVTPASRLEDIERDVKQRAVIGLKPYRLFSVTGDAVHCRIHEFLPHEQLELANEHGLWVTMHLSRQHGCADQANLDDLEEYTTRRYPNVKWILAHCARSFTYWPIREAVERLRDLPNIWYDLSAVTDIRPVLTLLKEENRKRIFYGSDGVDATYFRGQYVALGRAWQGFDADRMELKFPHCDGRPILAIYEQLLSLKQAADFVGLTQDDVENIFWRNAAKAFGVTFES